MPEPETDPAEKWMANKEHEPGMPVSMVHSTLLFFAVNVPNGLEFSPGARRVPLPVLRLSVVKQAVTGWPLSARDGSVTSQTFKSLMVFEQYLSS